MTLLTAAPTILPPVVFSSAFTSTRPLKVEIPETLKWLLACILPTNVEIPETYKSRNVPIPAGGCTPVAPI